jgi:exodeoxyribonuclease-3
MRLLTWNINSVRLRLDLIADLVRQLRPDILCLQEIKVVNELFPAAATKRCRG